MIQKLFLLAISISLLFGKSCHNNFTPNSFEEASDNFIEFIEENFLEQNLSFSPERSFKNIKIKIIQKSLKKIVIELKEPNRLTPIEAFNAYNDLLGNFFYDYQIDSYKMEFIPYEVRVNYKDKFLGVSVEVVGFRGGNSHSKTQAKIIFIDYSEWVKEYLECKRRKDENSSFRR